MVHYAPGGVVIVQTLGLSQHLIALARRLNPDGEFVVSSEQRLTRRQVFARVEALAAGLQALGVQKGDRVVTLLPPCPEAVYALFLPWALGSVEVPLNPLLREHELRHILADCAARVVITTQSWYGQNYPEMLARLLPDLPNLQAVVVRGADGGNGRAFLALDEVMAADRPLRRVKLSPGDLGRIAYTSGTTGLPKGVMHTRDGYWGLAHPAVIPRLRRLGCLLLPFPLCYYSGYLGVCATLLAGGKVILTERFDPRWMLETVQQERVSQLAASPTMYRLLLQTPGQERYDLSSVQHVMFSTEPCSPEVAQALHERFHCTLENVYGSNEAGNITWTALGDPWERVAATVGRPVPGARVRIVDDDRRPLPAGETGEIAIRTSQMMLGYYGDPELTAQVLGQDGWFYTGDLGHVGEDGYLRLTGRKKDLIIRGGQNVYPEEVEGYLQRHPAIRRAGVVGVPGGPGGEEVWANQERCPGAHVTVAEVLDFCRGQIAPFKIPEQVRFVERLPVTVTDKVQRFRLREMAARELDA
jgi:fatty-acyl-CoA synthase/long-chain acyl-CoA synthetase